MSSSSSSSSPWLGFAREGYEGGGGLGGLSTAGALEKQELFCKDERVRAAERNLNSKDPSLGFYIKCLHKQQHRRITQQQNKYHNKHLRNTGHYEPILFGLIF